MTMKGMGPCATERCWASTDRSKKKRQIFFITAIVVCSLVSIRELMPYEKLEFTSSRTSQSSLSDGVASKMVAEHTLASTMTLWTSIKGLRSGNNMTVTDIVESVVRNNRDGSGVCQNFSTGTVSQSNNISLIPVTNFYIMELNEHAHYHGLGSIIWLITLFELYFEDEIDHIKNRGDFTQAEVNGVTKDGLSDKTNTCIKSSQRRLLVLDQTKLNVYRMSDRHGCYGSHGFLNTDFLVLNSIEERTEFLAAVMKYHQETNVETPKIDHNHNSYSGNFTGESDVELSATMDTDLYEVPLPRLRTVRQLATLDNILAAQLRGHNDSSTTQSVPPIVRVDMRNGFGSAFYTLVGTLKTYFISQYPTNATLYQKLRPFVCNIQFSSQTSTRQQIEKLLFGIEASPSGENNSNSSESTMPSDTNRIIPPLPHTKLAAKAPLSSTLGSESQVSSLGIHIRRGDKKIETRYFEVHEYIEKVYAVLTPDQIKSIKYCYIATDDYTVVDQFRQAMSSFHGSAQQLNEGSDRGVESQLLNCTIHTRASQNYILKRDHAHTWDLFADLYMLARTTYFVGSFTSNLGKLSAFWRSCVDDDDDDDGSFSTYRRRWINASLENKFNNYFHTYFVDQEEWGLI